MNLTTLGVVAGGLGLAYLAFGKKTRFLGDKVEVGDAVSIPLSATTQKFDPTVWGTIPPLAANYVFTVDAAGADILTGRPAGLVLALPTGTQFVPFPNQAFLEQEHILMSGLRKDVQGVMRGGRQVVL